MIEMQKTKLGITIAMFAAAIYVVALVGGYVPAILLGGYVLLREENEWLKWNAVRAVALLACFSLLTALIGLIPDGVGTIVSFINLFKDVEDKIYLNNFNSVFNLIDSIIGIVKTVFFLILSIDALKMKSFKLPVVDKVVQANM